MRNVQRVLSTLLGELSFGSGAETAWVLNRQDPGLLRSLDQLSAAAASKVAAGGTSSIAAHADHLRYGLQLMNRWAQGEEPFADADYSVSWQRVSVSEDEWLELRRALRHEIERWGVALLHPREPSEPDLTGMVGSVVHLSYHLGAIRQIDRATQGPKERPSQR